MEALLGLKKILKKGEINSELELERALILDRKLRLLQKDNPDYIQDRKILRNIIQKYENLHWKSNTKLSEAKVLESDQAEIISEHERIFIETRKEIIKEKLKSMNLNQQDFGKILGHGKTYTSELINGINPFSLKDLIIINRIFQIDFDNLIPSVISEKDNQKIRETILKLNNPNLKFDKGNFTSA